MTNTNRLAGLMGLALLLLTACIVPLDADDDGASLTFENGTGEPVIVLSGRPGVDLAETLAQGLPVPPLASGATMVRSLASSNDAGEWCSAGDLWIMRPNVALNEFSLSTDLTTDEVTVIEKYEKPVCWGTDPDAYLLIE